MAIGLTVGYGWDDVRAYSLGFVRAPGIGEPSPYGGCFLLDGWDDHSRRWIVRNPVDRCFGRDGLGTLEQSVTCTPWIVHEVVALFDVLMVKE